MKKRQAAVAVCRFREGAFLMTAVYHPSALLRDETKKPQAWEDMQSLRDKLIELGCYEDLLGSSGRA